MSDELREERAKTKKLREALDWWKREYENKRQGLLKTIEERDAALAEVKDYRRTLDFGIECMSCASTLEKMHKYEAQRDETAKELIEKTIEVIQLRLARVQSLNQTLESSEADAPPMSIGRIYLMPDEGGE